MDVLLFLCKAVWWLLRILGRGVLGLFGLARRDRHARRDGAHGTARFAYRWELLFGGVLSGKGPVIGRGPWRRLMRFTHDGLMFVFATTGAGKGVGIVIPTLLDYPGSILVTDPKGENYAITRRRREQLGSVRMLNPTDLAASDRFNPLDMIRVGSDLEADDAKAVARLMVKPDAQEAHWDDKAISLLTALILHTLREPPETRTLAHVRALSVGGPETFRATLEEIAYRSTSTLAAEIASGFLGQIGDDPGRTSEEFKSVLSNVAKATEQWSAGSPAGRLSASSTFSLNELVDGVCTLYLCVDEELLQVYERWLRVMTGCVLATLTRAKYRPRSRYRVVLLLDEVAVLGPLDPLENQSGLLRAYCTPVLIWQSMPQMAAVYGEKRAGAFLANATCRVFFGVNDNDTAEYVATMVGNTTTFTSSFGVSQASDALIRHNQQQGKSESGYWLLDPSEVQRLPVTRLVAKFRDIECSTLVRRIDYRRAWRWRGLWDTWRPVATVLPFQPRGGEPAVPPYLEPAKHAPFGTDDGNNRTSA
ncbi:MAG: hypothetical protein B7X99_06765 [Rhizobiales bacterium 17-65-6]|nr:MAG: hypothetical protein B7X99_06765 [Rhizobiales bacterium 17-65-6]